MSILKNKQQKWQDMSCSRPFSVSEMHPQAPLETQAGPSPAGGPKWGAGEPGNTSSPEKAYGGLSISSAQNAHRMPDRSPPSYLILSAPLGR